MKNEIVHLGLQISDNVSDQEIERYKRELEFQSLNIDIRKFPFGEAQANLEWAVSTFIAVYILKPYFEEFLKGMGKDHYVLLKNWLFNQSKDVRKIKINKVTGSLSSDKSQSDSQSKAFSLIAILDHGQKIKFLFNDKLQEEDWNSAIELALKLLEEHFSNGQTDLLSIEIKNLSSESTIYARIKNDSVEWEFLDIRKSLTQNNY